MPRNRRRPSRPGWVSPVGKGASFERIDQGVDWSQAAPYVAVANGRVSAISRGWHGGTGIGVYITLDKPITVNGRTYSQVYYAELQPLVRVGQRVRAGQPVAAGGAGELGFASNNGPVAPLAGGLGAGTQESVAGHDFLDLAQGNAHVQIGVAAPDQQATASYNEGRRQRQLPRSRGGGIGYDSLPPANESTGFGPEQSGQQEGAFGLNPYQVADVWQQIANQQFASPETRQIASNAASLMSNVPNLLQGP